MCWRGLVFPFLNSRSFSASFLNSCTGKVYYRSADRTWFTLLYLSVQSYLVSQFCFRVLFRKLFWKCRFIQSPALGMRSHPFTQPVLALVFSFFKVSFLIACTLTNTLMKTTIPNFGLYAKTPWMTWNVSELFLKAQRCHVSGVRTCLYFWVQQWQYGGKQTAEPSCLSFLLNGNSFFIEECAPHLGHAVHTNSRQCYVHILCAFPFTGKTKTCTSLSCSLQQRKKK